MTVNYTVNAPSEDVSRLNYAKWFVREHFLPQDYDKWFVSRGVQDDLMEWADIVHNRRIRWFEVTDVQGYEAARREQRKSCFGFWGEMSDFEKAKYGTWWRIELADLDLEINDPNPHVKEARRQRQVHHDNELWQWLIKEAEYQRVYWEALVRSYGVDVHSP